MESLYAWLPLLGCGVMMFVCMKMMGGMGQSSEKATSNLHDSDEAEVLRARITELERRLEVESASSTPPSKSGSSSSLASGRE